MLLTQRNGSAWLLTDVPEKKYLHALNAARLKPYSVWVILPATLLAVAPAFTVFLLIWTGSISVDAHLRGLVTIPLLFVTFPIGTMVMHPMMTRPENSERALSELQRGFVDNIVPDTAYAYQLIAPAIIASQDDPTRQSAISDYFQRVRKMSKLNAWWTPNWWLEFQQTHDERLVIYHAATLLMDRYSEFRPLLSMALGEFERQLQADYATGLRKDIATKLASIGSHQDTIRKEQNAIASLQEGIRDQELILGALQPFNKE